MNLVDPSTRGTAIPAELDSARAKLIYLYLSLHDAATLEDIADDLDMPMTTLCSLLRTLEKEGLVARDDRGRISTV